MIFSAAGAVLIAAVKRVVRIIRHLPNWATAVSWLVFALPLPLQAHEFWIEPSSFQPDPGQSLTADLLIGTDFLGASAIYVPDQIEKFALLGTGAKSQSERYEISGRYGDRPAGKMASGSPGLSIIVHQTAPIRLTYDDAKKFDEFAREKGFDDALVQHQDREKEEHQDRTGSDGGWLDSTVFIPLVGSVKPGRLSVQHAGKGTSTLCLFTIR